MQSALNRRALMAGAAAVPVAALPSLPALASEPDPIFAVIERHRSAFAAWMPPLKISSNIPMSDPAFPPAEEVTAHYGGLEHEAAVSLASILPTTIAGVIALLTYIHAYNRGFCGEYVGESQSCNWPNQLVDYDELRHNGEPLEMEFAFWIIRNVETALRDIAGGTA